MKLRKALRLILLLVCLCVFILSGYKIISLKMTEKKASDLYDSTFQKAVTVNTVSDAGNFGTGTDAPLTEQLKAPISINFNLLQEQCDDIVGWLYSPGTPINYPVVKGKDNAEYLNKMFNGESNRAGSLFVDYRLDDIDNCRNYIIYGHNMKNNTMFGTLDLYKKQEYYEQHKVIYYLTPESEYAINVYAGFVTAADSDSYKMNRTEQELESYMANMKEWSTFNSGINYLAGDNIVTLSTCAYNYKDARYVLVGIIKKI